MHKFELKNFSGCTCKYLYDWLCYNDTWSFSPVSPCTVAYKSMWITRQTTSLVEPNKWLICLKVNVKGQFRKNVHQCDTITTCDLAQEEFSIYLSVCLFCFVLFCCKHFFCFCCFVLSFYPPILAYSVLIVFSCAPSARIQRDRPSSPLMSFFVFLYFALPSLNFNL